jgi:ER membrane protein complex subunit 1, C-terminal/PQQ-like domain
LLFIFARQKFDSINFSCFFFLMTMTKWIATILLMLFVVKSVHSMYIDEAGQIDWHLENLGQVVDALHSTQGLFVSSFDGVLALLDAESGETMWRRVLTDSRSLQCGRSVLAEHDDVLYATHGQHAGKFVSAFDAYDGSLIWQHVNVGAKQIRAEQQALENGDDENLKKFDDRFFVSLQVAPKRGVVVCGTGNRVLARTLDDGALRWFFDVDGDSERLIGVRLSDDQKRVLALIGNTRIGGDALLLESARVVAIDARNGNVLADEHVPFDGAVRCALLGKHFACLSVDGGDALSVFAFDSGAVLATRALDAAYALMPIDNGDAPAALGSAFVLRRRDAGISDDDVVATLAADGSLTLDARKRGERYQWAADGSRRLHAVRADGAVIISGGSAPVARVPADAVASASRIFSARRAATIVVGADLSLSACTAASAATSDLLWVREEALARLTDALFVELPLPAQTASDTDREHALESLPAAARFVARWQLHAEELVEVLFDLAARARQLLGGGSGCGSDAASQLDSRRRIAIEADRFGFRQLILAPAADVGKLFALHTERGDVLWSAYFDGYRIDSVHVLRSPAYDRPRAAVVLRRRDDASRCAVVELNPVSGAREYGPLRELSFSVLSAFVIDAHAPADEAAASVTPLLDDGSSASTHGLGELVLVDTDHVRHRWQSSVASAVSAERESRTLRYVTVADDGASGHEVAFDGERARQVWRVELPAGERVAAHSVASDAEARVDRPTRTFGNGSIATKYANANLLVLATLGESGSSKKHAESVLNVYLLDGVSGQLLKKYTHRGGAGPLSIAQCEHWVAYQYWHAASHRFELASVALYDTSTDWHELADKRHFSAADNIEPLADAAAFVPPLPIVAMRPTVTEHAITPRHLLVATADHRVLAFDARLLDARRPMPDAITAEDREEQLVPYQVNLMAAPRGRLSYNRTVYNLRSVHAAPSALESTSLVLAVGLDVFFTRFSPARNFDVLHDEFNRPMLVLTTFGALVAVLVTRHLRHSKQLKNLWQ